LHHDLGAGAHDDLFLGQGLGQDALAHNTTLRNAELFNGVVAVFPLIGKDADDELGLPLNKVVTDGLDEALGRVVGDRDLAGRGHINAEGSSHLEEGLGKGLGLLHGAPGREKDPVVDGKALDHVYLLHVSAPFRAIGILVDPLVLEEDDLGIEGTGGELKEVAVKLNVPSLQLGGNLLVVVAFVDKRLQSLLTDLRRDNGVLGDRLHDLEISADLIGESGHATKLGDEVDDFFLLRPPSLASLELLLLALVHKQGLEKGKREKGKKGEG